MSEYAEALATLKEELGHVGGEAERLIVNRTFTRSALEAVIEAAERYVDLCS